MKRQNQWRWFYVILTLVSLAAPFNSPQAVALTSTAVLFALALHTVCCLMVSTLHVAN